jgi:hypothetical protein
LTRLPGCRKGKRECHYPEPNSAKSSTGASSKDDAAPNEISPETSAEEEDEVDEQSTQLNTIIYEEDEEGDNGSGGGGAKVAFRAQEQPRASSKWTGPRRVKSTPVLNLQRAALRPSHGSESPTADNGPKSSSPSASTGTAGSSTPAFVHFPESRGPLLPFVSRPEWAHLPRDFQFYLAYFCDNMTHFHYCMVTDAYDFFRETLPAMALHDEALLNAVVGFAAYHYTVGQPGGKVKDFLQYYNTSVTLLLRAFKQKQGYNLTTLMTILQLGTIEVRLEMCQDQLCRRLTSFGYSRNTLAIGSI